MLIMKRTNKNTIIWLLLIACLAVSCVKEDPDEVSAKFTTDLTNNTLQVGSDFTLDLNQADGEFLTYFTGETPEQTYPDGVMGIAIENTESDFVTIGSAYSTTGTFTFTLVARSYGNWGEDLNETSESIQITVVE